MARRRHKAILREAIQVNFLSPTRRRATVEHVHDWLTWVGVKTLFIEPGSPWENGYVESFNEKLCNKLFEGEIFYTLREAKVMIEKWHRHYHEVCLQSSLATNYLLQKQSSLDPTRYQRNSATKKSQPGE